jgi:hypothetical protein
VIMLDASNKVASILKNILKTIGGLKYMCLGDVQKCEEW